MLLEEGVCYDQRALLSKLLAFSLFHFVLHGQTCLLIQGPLPIFAFQLLMMKRTSFLVLVLEGLVGHHRTFQLQLPQHYWLGHRLVLL